MQKHCQCRQKQINKTLKYPDSKIMESSSPTTERLKNVKYAPQVYQTTLTLSLNNNTGTATYLI